MSSKGVEGALGMSEKEDTCPRSGGNPGEKKDEADGRFSRSVKYVLGTEKRDEGGVKLLQWEIETNEVENVETHEEKQKLTEEQKGTEAKDEGSDDEDVKDLDEASKRAKEVLRDLRKKHSRGPELSYRMTNKRRGTAAIFNIGEFEQFSNFDHDYRSGYLIDGCMMKSVWADLGFDVKYYQDLGTKEVEKALQELSSESHEDSDCFVLVFMSYGGVPGLEDDMVCSTDGLHSVQVIVDRFNAKNTPSLMGKPKLFFIQACRGGKVDRGVIVKDIETDARSRKSGVKVIPVEADILLSQATVRGYASFRHIDSGSVYIKYLAHVLSVYGKEKDINWIMTKVNSMVAENYCEYSLQDDDARKQMPVFTSMLTKQVIFK